MKGTRNKICVCCALSSLSRGKNAYACQYSTWQVVQAWRNDRTLTEQSDQTHASCRNWWLNLRASLMHGIANLAGVDISLFPTSLSQVVLGVT